MSEYRAKTDLNDKRMKYRLLYLSNSIRTLFSIIFVVRNDDYDDDDSDNDDDDDDDDCLCFFCLQFYNKSGNSKAAITKTWLIKLEDTFCSVTMRIERISALPYGKVNPATENKMWSSAAYWVMLRGL
ncbi:hypothetical protein GQX74_015545 [Glossina fuscipes]|nr:hypothetical protein GQX74_015545 [Glossina fuscipes]